MKAQRIKQHRKHGMYTLNERKFFYFFSGWNKLSRGIMPSIPECNALERIGIKCNHCRNCNHYCKNVNIIIGKGGAIE